MNCFTHETSPAVGLCAMCQRALCRSCVATDQPRMLCRSCATRGVIGFEYKSELAFGSWPLVHVCMGADPLTLRPRVARGVVAIGNISVGGIAIGGLAAGIFSLGGLSVGALLAVGGAALGLGISLGGFALGSVAVGGLAVGLQHAVGGAAFAPSVIDGARCDEAARLLVERWVGAGALPPSCR